jgi:hypothetical protein
LVCDVVSAADRNGDGDAVDCGEFGDGSVGVGNPVKNNDVVAIFRASLQEELQPPPGSPAFVAMDAAAPLDQPPHCGGDGVIANNDVVECFRRSLNQRRANFTRIVNPRACSARPLARGSTGSSARAAAGQTAAGGGTITAGMGVGRPGDVAAVPITLKLDPGGEVATLQFNLTVAPVGDAPALTEAAAFEPASGLATPPSFNFATGKTSVLVGWLSEFSPRLTGTVELGTLRVLIPVTASPQATYVVQVRNATGTPDGLQNLTLAGVAGKAGAPCGGDCNEDLDVTINELLTMVNIALGNTDILACPVGDANGDGDIAVNEIIAGVNNAEGLPRFLTRTMFRASQPIRARRTRRWPTTPPNHVARTPTGADLF